MTTQMIIASIQLTPALTIMEQRMPPTVPTAATDMSKLPLMRSVPNPTIRMPPWAHWYRIVVRLPQVKYSGLISE